MLRTCTLSTVEYALVGGVLGAETMIGIADPFAGLLTEEIRGVLDQARDALADRQLIEIRPDRRVMVEPATAVLVSTCAFPEAAFVLTLNQPGQPAAQRYFHVTRHAAVEMVESPRAEPAVTLVQLEGAEGLYGRVCELCQLRGQVGPPVRGGEVPRAELARAAASGANQAAAVEALRQAGLDPDTAAALAGTLARPILNASFVVLAQRGERWTTDGLGLLLGENGLWRLGPALGGDAPRVSVKPCTADQLRAEILRAMNRVLPRPIDRKQPDTVETETL